MSIDNIRLNLNNYPINKKSDNTSRFTPKGDAEKFDFTKLKAPVNAGPNAVSAGSNAVNAGPNAVSAGSNAVNAGSNAVSAGSNAVNPGSNAVNPGSNTSNPGSNAGAANSKTDKVVLRSRDVPSGITLAGIKETIAAETTRAINDKGNATIRRVKAQLESNTYEIDAAAIAQRMINFMDE